MKPTTTLHNCFSFTRLVLLISLIFSLNALHAQNWLTPNEYGGGYYNNNLQNVYFKTATQGWAVGLGGRILSTSNGGTTWTQQTSGTTFDLYGVFFISTTQGWVVGAGGTLLTTNNGGTTWTPQTPGVVLQCNSVYFVSSTVGCIVGNNGTILTTADGGTTWTARTSGTAQILNSVFFANATQGWAVGYGGVIRTTNDGGATWTAQTSGILQTLFSVYFTSATKGWAVGDAGVIRTTNDGGANWTAQTSGTANRLNSVSFSSANQGWVVASGGIIRTTNDGGANWTAQTSNTSVFLNGVSFTNATNGWAVGDGANILFTNDGGTTWTSQTAATKLILYNTFFTSDTKGWAVGEQGTILTTNDGALNWTAQFSGVSGGTDVLKSISFVSPTQGWVVGGNSNILTTSNGGVTWTAQNAGAENWNNTFFRSTTLGWVVGQNGVIYKTINGGTAWTAQTLGTTNHAQSIFFISDTKGWVVGNGGFIRTTNDGGANWTTQTSSTTDNLNSVFFVDNNIGWAVGSNLRILKTIDGGANWTTQGSAGFIPLRSVYFTSATQGWVVGENNIIRYTNDGGTTWFNQTASDNNVFYYSIFFRNSGKGFLVGSGGKIFLSPSNNADLSAMTLSSGTLAPVFAAGTTSYTANVPNATSSITVTPTRAQVNATIQVRVNNGTFANVASGTASSLLALNVGTNTIDVRVTAQDGVTQKTYTTTITRAVSTNANLSAMTISTGTLNPTFTTGTIAYTATVPNATSSITITPTREEANATIQVRANTGTYATVVSGTASSALALNVGANTVDVLVTAQDGTTQKTYSITVTRAPAPPTFTSFSLIATKPGDQVSITGGGFTTTPDNYIVSFGATRTTVTALSPLSMLVTVPNGATHSPINIYDKQTGLSTNSLNNFIPIFSPTKTAIGSSDFSAKVDFTAGTRPFHTAISDLDGDGKPDLIVANRQASTISILRNISTNGSIDAGSFAPKVDFTVDAEPVFVSTGDIDGDGKPEIAILTLGSNFVTILRNTSTSGNISASSFASKVEFATGNQPFSLAFGDLDGDGKTDMAVANNTLNSVSIFRNTSTIGTINGNSFSARVDFSTGNNSNPISIAIGDLNGDGKPDMVVANTTTNNISIFQNSVVAGFFNAGSFLPRIDISTGASAWSVALGDLDRDGKLDIAVANDNNMVSVFRNINNLGAIFPNSFEPKVDFSAGGRGLAIGDLTGDGKPELVSVNAGLRIVSVLTNNAVSGSISSSSFSNKVDFTTGEGPFSTAIGDLDGDSKPDLVIGYNNSTNLISVLRNLDPPPAPPTITSFTQNVKPGDQVSIVGTNFNTTAANNIVFFGATRATVTAITTGFSTSVLTVTVPTGATYGPISVLNTGNGLTAYSLSNFNPIYSPAKTSITTRDFAPKVDFASGSNPFSVVIGDFDGDGKPDMAVASSITNSFVSVYRNTSTTGSINTGSFANKIDFSTGSSPYVLSMGDLDGDGKPDLAIANTADATISVLRNTSTIGSISFAARVNFPTGTGPYSVAIGDLDGDGKPDLAVANFSSNTVSIFRNNSTLGSISFSAKVDFTTGTNPRSISIGDLDGDGKPDLAVANITSNNVSVFRNTSTRGSIDAGSFAAKVDFTTGDAVSVTIGDLDGDGKSDLVVANYISNSISLLRNTANSGSIGPSSFAAKVDFETGTLPYLVSLGDFDGDGKPDLAVANSGSGFVSVYRNTATSGILNIASLAPRVDLITIGGQRSVAIGDLDGDGRPDIAVPNYNLNAASVLQNILPSNTINSTGTLTTLNTTYGTASSNTSFSVSGSSLTANILVTPPSGFEVSTSSTSGFAPTVTLPQVNGTVAATTIFVRLSATTPVGNYSGNIVLSSTGAANINVPTVLSTVTAKALTISGITANNKVFDGNTTATLSGTPSLVGVNGSDNVLLGGTPVATFASSAAGNNIAVTVTGYTISGTAASNYTLTQPTGLTANITSATITLTGTLSAFSSCISTPSTPQSFSVLGTNLVGNISVTAPTGYELSTSATGTYSSNVALSPVSGTVTSTTIFVRLNRATLGSISGNIVASSTNATNQTLGVSGTVNVLLTVAPITGAQQVCFASTTPFASTTTGGVWSSNNTTAATVNATTGIVTGMQSGTATISYAVTNAAGGCVTTVTRDITVNALPLITASASLTVVFKGQSTQLNVSAVGNIASFVWSPSGGTLTTNPASTTVRVTQNTTYTVTATSTAGCVNTANVAVTTKDEVYVETVNVFSPNGDGINDRFVIKNLDLYPNNKLQVFDRTGKIIYEQNNYANTWDGYVNGKLLTKDTYFYVLTVNGLIVKKATITLVR